MKKLFLFAGTLALFLAAGCRITLNQAGAYTPVPPRLNLTLPETVYTAPGLETNIYFENVIDSATPEAYAVEVKCPRGTHGNKRWFWTPDAKDAGKEFVLELRLFNDWGMIASKKCKVVVAREAADRKAKITLALLGDSGVNCRYPTHLLNVMRERGYANYTPVGKHSGSGKPVVPGGIAHDGYGGFSWQSFLERWVYSTGELPQAQNEAEKEQMRALGVRNIPQSQMYRMRSPLLKVVNGKKVLDIPGWFGAINKGKAPDFIVIQLGGNDVFSTRAEKLDERIKYVMGNARKLLAELRKHAPNAKIGVASGVCGCAQDGFGANYNCYQSKYQYRRNILRYTREIAALVKELNDPKLSFIPMHHNIDPENSFITGSFPVHARSKQKVVRLRNALHPSITGGYQLGDAIACWLLKQLEK